MENGGPIAFYEVAAALIPLLFLGGVVLEIVRPPRRDKRNHGGRGSETIYDNMKQPAREAWVARQFPGSPALQRLLLWTKFWKQYSLTTALVVYSLPVLGAWVIFVEIVALDAIASGSTDTLHAAVVGGTLIFGLVLIVIAIWVPWVVRLAEDGRMRSQHRWIASVLTLLVPIGGIMLVAGLGTQPWVTPSLTDLFRAAEGKSQQDSSKEIWLEHLIATSDYRIDKLEEEKEHTHDRAVRRRIRRHLDQQINTRKTQEKALNNAQS